MPDLVLTGIIDGDLSGGLPKAIQLHATGAIEDLSVFGLGSANNGNGGGVVEFTFPAISVAAGTTLYVASEIDSFTAFFGFAPDFTGAVASINGDDAIELFENGAVIDVFGDVATDGTGQPWEYQDGWAYRAPTSGASPVFDPADWIFSGPNALDGVTTNTAAPTPFPMPGGGPASPAVAINEYRISSPSGSDDASNFVELVATPGAALTRLTLVGLSGEFEPGQIDWAIDLDAAVADADGFVLIANTANPALGPGDVAVTDLDFFGSPQSFLVVEDFTGALGEDLDTDNDGLLDTTPWSAIRAAVSAEDGDATPDRSYADTIVPPDGSFPAAGAARRPDATGPFVPLPFSDQSGDTPGATNTPDAAAERATIMQIQGAGHVSAFVSDAPLDPTTGDGPGGRVTTSGIVTAVDSNGFYLQDPLGDADIATSDALFVFTGGTPGVVIGDALEVTGTVSEFYPGGQGTGNLSTTQLGGALEIRVTSSGNALPDAVLLGSAGRGLPSRTIEDDGFASFDPETDGIDFFESLEGMRVTAPDPVAVSGTSRFGEVFVVVDGGAGASGLSSRGTLNISPEDFNPEKVQIDWDFGLEALDVDVGAAFRDITGVVSYDFGNYQINPTAQLVEIAPSSLAPEVTDLRGDARTLSVASYNVLNLDPIVEDQALTNNGEARNVDDDVGNGRFAAIAAQITGNLGSPDIIGLQEIQDNTGGETGDGVVSASLTFETLIDAIDLADDGVANDSSGYAFIDNTFITDLASGGQPGGNIRTGFLYREDRVALVEGSARTIGSQEPGGAFEGARLPLVADFAFNGDMLTVVNNHFSSKGGSAPILGVEQDFAARQEDVTVNGSLDERQDQSAAIAGFVSNQLTADPEANLVVLGDFNEFEFVSPLTALEDAGLTNLTTTLPEDERYTFNFQGNSQALDHILVSDALADAALYDVVHVNSEFAETPQRASDHDPLVALLAIGEAAPETVEVAVTFESLFVFGTRARESVGAEPVDTDFVPFLRNALHFTDVDVKMKAVAPGSEKIVAAAGEIGIWSRADGIFSKEARLVNDRETLVFTLTDGALGDATEATFAFAELRGGGKIEVRAFDNGALVERAIFEPAGEDLVVDFDGARFDTIRLSAIDDTAFSLDGFAFERIAPDDFVFV